MAEETTVPEEKHRYTRVTGTNRTPLDALQAVSLQHMINPYTAILQSFVLYTKLGLVRRMPVTCGQVVVLAGYSSITYNWLVTIQSKYGRKMVIEIQYAWYVCFKRAKLVM